LAKEVFMKMRVSPDLCCGAQRCAVVAPDVFTIVDGFNALVAATHDYVVPEQLKASAIRGARACPEGAIRIIEEGP
jgi:ferredoxin